METVTSPNYTELFREYVKAEFNRDAEEVNAIWFKDEDRCFPAEYMGDELLKDIADKFGQVFDFLTSLLEKDGYRQTDFRTVIESSYEMETIVVVIFKDRVVHYETTKAWYFTFKDDVEFNKWVSETLEQWKKKLADIPLSSP